MDLFELVASKPLAVFLRSPCLPGSANGAEDSSSSSHRSRDPFIEGDRFYRIARPAGRAGASCGDFGWFCQVSLSAGIHRTTPG